MWPSPISSLISKRQEIRDNFSMQILYFREVLVITIDKDFLHPNEFGPKS